MVSPAQRQSSELFKKARGLYRWLRNEHDEPEAPEPQFESALQIELSNGSRIVALPGGKEGTTIRGFSSVALLIVDEAARVLDPLYASVRRMLAISGGRLLALSTCPVTCAQSTQRQDDPRSNRGACTAVRAADAAQGGVLVRRS